MAAPTGYRHELLSKDTGNGKRSRSQSRQNRSCPPKKTTARDYDTWPRHQHDSPVKNNLPPPQASGQTSGKTPAVRTGVLPNSGISQRPEAPLHRSSQKSGERRSDAHLQQPLQPSDARTRVTAQDSPVRLLAQSAVLLLWHQI